ncbi:phosphonopyruvate decarboxylase [Candidatus Woesearchaeota archaeon]|nr:phosphonopyruvate decarboxylase [Candidatus Woesearchaeota archaeon]
MINCKEFYDKLNEKGIDFFAGVPDSLLKDFCAYITDNAKTENHIITANEGGAIALATGYYLATGKMVLVYMQNSGQGNAVNPLISLADSDVYSIPLLMMVGWRGEPGKKDEPQHKKQGKITLALLETMGIEYAILPDDMEEAAKIIDCAVTYMAENNAPYALIIKKGTFESYSLKTELETFYDLNREQAIKLILDQLNPNDIVISTTGKTSRELFEYREESKQGHEKDFLTVGSMGHASQIALGIALSKPDRQVYCFDGDGAVIMHTGSLAIIGSKAPKNFKHVVFNNGAHDSVGGQPTVGFEVDFPAIAQACGYQNVKSAEKIEDIKEKIQLLKTCEGPALLEIKINKGARKDLGRPTTTPKDNKKAFMEFLKRQGGEKWNRRNILEMAE